MQRKKFRWEKGKFFNDFLDGGKTHGSIGAVIHMSWTPLREETRKPTRPQDLVLLSLFCDVATVYSFCVLLQSNWLVSWVLIVACRSHRECQTLFLGLNWDLAEVVNSWSKFCLYWISIVNHLFICVFKGSLLFSKGLIFLLIRSENLLSFT